MPYTPIPCSVHDHLELACIASAELLIELRDGSTVTVTPITTESRSDKTEWLLCNDGVEIPLGQINAFAPTRQTSLFSRIEIP